MPQSDARARILRSDAAVRIPLPRVRRAIRAAPLDGRRRPARLLPRRPRGGPPPPLGVRRRRPRHRRRRRAGRVVVRRLRRRLRLRPLMPDFTHQELLPLGADDTPYRLLTTDGVSTFEAAGETFLRVDPEVLTLLTRSAMHDIAHLLRPGHLQQL